MGEIRVEQRHRDAAVSILGEGLVEATLHNDILEGRADSHPLVQAFVTFEAQAGDREALFGAVIEELRGLTVALRRLLQQCVEAIDTGRNEPLEIVRDHLRNHLADFPPLPSLAKADAIVARATPHD